MAIKPIEIGSLVRIIPPYTTFTHPGRTHVGVVVATVPATEQWNFGRYEVLIGDEIVPMYPYELEIIGETR